MAEQGKTTELGPEDSLETTPSQTPDLPTSVSTSKTSTDSRPSEKIEAPSPFPSFAALMSAHTELLQSEISSDDSSRPGFLEKVKEFIRRGTETGTRLGDTDQRRTAQSLLNYWVTVLYRADATPPPDAILAFYSAPEDLGFDASDCPYIGLSPFREADSESFFGREQLTTAIVQRLKEKRLVVLVGPSGSGKTSALNAGVLPVLKKGVELPESNDWIYFPSIAPGSDPLAVLASLFSEETKQTADELLQKPEHLLQLLNQPNFGGKPALLIIDQFEELFTVCKDDKKREAFINSLLSLKNSSIKHRVILSMRSDRINQIVRRPTLNEAFRDAEIRVYPPREVDLHEIIEKPAQRIGLKFQSGVVEQLIREIFGDPVGLPLLQFALLELWADREGSTITWAALNRLVSCRQALVSKAENFYQNLTPDEKTVARRILLRMVRLSGTWEATTEPVRREDLYLPGEDGKLVNLVLSKLLAANLARISNISYGSKSPSDGVSGSADVATELSPDHQFELAHESLAHYWPEIVGWLRKLREAMVTRQRLELFAANWAILGRSEKGLLDKFQLHEAETWLATEEAKELGHDPDLDALVRRSRKAIKRERLIKAILISTSLGLMLFALIVTALFFYLEHGRLKKATSMRLALQASPNIANQLDLALLLSLEAYRKDNENPEARTSLMRALTYSPNMSAYLHNQGKIGEIVFSENGSQLSVLGINGTATLWDTRKHQPIGNIPKSELEIDAGSNTSTSRNCSLLSHDGRWLVSIDEQGSLFIQSVENPAQIRTIPHTKMTCSQTPFLSLSNDNKKLAWLTPIHGNADPDAQELTVWDADKPDRVKSVPRIAVVSIAFSPDNQILVTTNVEDDIVLVRADNLKPIGKPLRGAFNQNVLTNRIGFNKDGSRLASIKSNGDLAVWDVRNQKELHSLKRQEVATGQLETGDTLPSGFALSHTGDELVAGFADGSVVFSNIDTDRQAAYPARDKVPVTAIAFSPDENSVITLGGKSGPILWQKKSTQSGASSSWQDQPSSDAGGPGQIELRSGRAAAVSRIAFSPDSNMVAGACDDGTIVLWDLKHELPSNPFAAKGIVNFIFKEMPARTEMLARTESDEVVRFDMNGGKEISKFSIKPDWTQPDGNPPQFSDAVFNKNGTILAVSYSDNKVVVWDLEASLQKFVISDAGGGESTEDKQDARIFMAIDGEGKNLALAGDVGTEAIQLWSIDDRRMHSLTGIKNQVVSLTFSPDGKTLASGDYAGVITLWDTVAKKQRGTLFDESVSPSSNIEFTSDGTRLVSLSEDGTLRLWDVRPNTAPRWLLKPSTHISDFVLSPDSQRVSIVGIGDDGSILFWDLENGQEQFVFPSSEVDALGAGSILTALVYPPDGKTLAAGRNNGTVSLIRVDADYWIQRVCPIANRNLTQPEWSSYKVFEDNEWRFGWRTWKKEDAIYKQFGQTCVLPDNRDPGGISTEQ